MDIVPIPLKVRQGRMVTLKDFLLRTGEQLIFVKEQLGLFTNGRGAGGPGPREKAGNESV